MHLSKTKVHQICQKQFPECIVEEYSEITNAGLVNHIFTVATKNPSQELILKIYSKKWEHYKPEKEKFVYDLITEKTSLPVPQVYILDTSKSILPHTYLLMSKIQGTMLKTVRIPNKEKIFFELGKDLATLHGITLNAFGWIYKDKISRFENKFARPFLTAKTSFMSAVPVNTADFSP